MNWKTKADPFLDGQGLKVGHRGHLHSMPQDHYEAQCPVSKIHPFTKQSADIT